jgi:uncharacterized protein (UPF0262 family)
MMTDLYLEDKNTLLIKQYDHERSYFFFGLMESGQIFTGNPQWVGGYDVEEELMAAFALEIKTEIDTDILRTLKSLIK